MNAIEIQSLKKTYDTGDKALKGIDLFINLTMKNPQGGSETTQNLEDIQNNYDLNTKGLDTFLYLASRIGLQNFIHHLCIPHNFFSKIVGYISPNRVDVISPILDVNEFYDEIPTM